MSFRKKQEKPNTDIQVRGNTLPENFDMSSLADMGTEEIGVEDLPRPSLKLLQPLSPEVILGSESFVSDAKPGMFVNGATRQIYTGMEQPLAGDKPQLVIVPVKYIRREIEYKKDRGGFIGEHLPGSPITDGVTIVIGEKDKKHRITTTGTELIDTSIFYCLVIDPNAVEPIECVMSLYSTGKKFAKNFNAYMKGLRDKGPNGPYQPAMFSRVYTIFSELVNDPKGAHYIWKFKPNTVIDPNDSSHAALIVAALKYQDMINNDLVKVDHEAG